MCFRKLYFHIFHLISVVHTTAGFLPVWQRCGAAPQAAEEEVYTLYDMNSAEGIAKETFTDVYTYDETFETVQMDGYGDVLKLTAKNVITSSGLKIEK